MPVVRGPRLANGISLLLCLALLLCVAGCATRITRTADGREVPLPQLVQELSGERLILLGETHDEPRHHRLQLAVIRALHERGIDLAIAAEMFATASQQQLDLWIDGRMDTLSFEWLFNDNWSLPWPLYRDIFLYARDQRIPILGVNLDRKLVHTLSTRGMAALSAQEVAQLPADLTCDHGSPYFALLQDAYRSHSERFASFEDFCLAQTAWNRGMASRVTEYLKLHPEKTVVVLAGSFHAVRSAIPAAAGVGARVVVPAAVPGAYGQADFVFR